MTILSILTVATLYPNAAMPTFAPFVERRVRRLVASGAVATRVLAPVPWFPSASARFGAWARWARVPCREIRHGIEVFHPRYPHLPRIGTRLQPHLLGAVLERHARHLWHRGFRFALVDAHYAYPDGVAALHLARCFGVPLVVTARGTDLNLLPGLPGPRRQLARLAREADALVAVSAALARVWRELGAPVERVHVIRNGVDAELFRPRPRAQARRHLALPEGPLALTVGELIPRKGVDVLIRALAHGVGWRLLVVGDGPARGTLEHLAQDLGVEARVIFAGAQPPEALPQWYAAADLFALASRREGLPNVVLEALACGRPVVARAIWGVPEAVDGTVGRLVETDDPRAFAEAIAAVLADPPPAATVRRRALRFSWEETVRRLLALYRSLADRTP